MDLNAALLLLSLTGGYCFSVTWHPSLYRSARESGHKIYFRSVFYAFFSIIFSLEILLPIYFLGFLDVILQPGKINVADPVPIQFLKLIKTQNFLDMVLITSFLVGIFFPIFLNTFFQCASMLLPERLNFQLFLTRRAIRLNDFEKLLYRAAVTQTPVLVTLQTGKVYAGWMVDAPNPSAERRAIRLLPLLSGYRDRSHRLQFTTSYYEILTTVSNDEEDLDHLTAEDFEVVLPVDQIGSAHLFDLEAYNRFQISPDFVGPPERI